MTVDDSATLSLNSGVILTTTELGLGKASTVEGGSGAKYYVRAMNGQEGTATFNATTTVTGQGFEVHVEVPSTFKGTVIGNNTHALQVEDGAKVYFNDSLNFTLLTGGVDKAFDPANGTIYNLDKVTGHDGFLTEYYWTQLDQGAGYYALHTKASEESKAFSEGFMGGISLAIMGGDLATDQGIASATQSVARSGGAGESFAAVGGGKLKHKTGSHVDVSGTSLIAGVAAGVGNGVTVGGFVEYGDGDYDSHNSFSRGKVKGSGDVEYVGVGFLGRFDLPKTASGQPYLEATARFGRTKSDFKSNDLNGARYDTKSNYHGLSFGGGHVWNIGANGALLDLYGRYMWTRQAGDSVDVEGQNQGHNTRIKFGAVDSHRARVGVRYSTIWNGANRFYTGVAWEHEFDSEASAKVAGNKIDAPDMKGSTGVAEFGLIFNPADNKNLSIDLGVQAYGGKRSGATGSAQLKYTF
jgi:hypothetical protein